MHLVARIVLDIVITRVFITLNDMIRSHDVLAVNEEPRAVVHIIISKGHTDEKKGKYDEALHIASVGCILYIVILGNPANVKPNCCKIL